ncbi:MAG: hypothetical protein Q4G67_15330 [Actinomycetia bacterium]|nr:hypothetical protein [Actinomycetes bacterium]
MRLPSYPLTKTLALVSLGYVTVMALQPERLTKQLGGQVSESEAQKLTKTWAGRDLPVCALALAGPDSAVPTAVGLRIAADITDAVTLGTATTGKARQSVLAVTGGWGVAQLAAFLIDRRIGSSRE